MARPLEAPERVDLGRTGLQVTRLGFGAAPIGGLCAAVADADARATVERAWELGIRTFDVAPLYGYGTAERRLGVALAGRPRDDFVLDEGRSPCPQCRRHRADCRCLSPGDRPPRGCVLCPNGARPDGVRLQRRRHPPIDR